MPNTIEEYPDFEPTILTSDDRKDTDLVITEKKELIGAMLEDGSELLTVSNVVNQFGYNNPKTKRFVAPQDFSEQHITIIVKALRADYPNETNTSIKWNIKHLFVDLSEVVTVLDSVSFDVTQAERFPVEANDEGDRVKVLNTFNAELRPQSNTKVTPTLAHKLVANVVMSSIVASAEAMAETSQVDGNKEQLFDDIMTTLGGYVQKVHRRMKYAMVITGLQGSGKSILGQFLGGASGYSEAMSISKLCGDFSSRFDKALFILVDEASLMLNQIDKLKNFITGSTADFEEKYQSAKSIVLSFNMFFTLNKLEEFRVGETDNRRYFTLIHNGIIPPKGSTDITPLAKATPEEYKALCELRKFDFIEGNNKGMLIFERTAFSDELRADGKHWVHMSALGELSSKPKEFKGVFIEIAKQLAVYGEEHRKLYTTAARARSQGDIQLAEGVPTQLGVRTQHDIIASIINEVAEERGIDERIANTAYVNLNNVFSKGFDSKLGEYFLKKFVHKGQNYATIVVDRKVLLIPVKATELHTEAGNAIQDAAKAAYYKNESVDDVVTTVSADFAAMANGYAIIKYMASEIGANDATISLKRNDLMRGMDQNRAFFEGINSNLPEGLTYKKLVYTYTK